MTTFLTLTFSLFLLMDSVGNIPLFVSLLKNFKPAKQRKIILRELVIALLFLLFFNFLGEHLLALLKIDEESVMIAGGLILFLIALRMIFPVPKDNQDEKLTEEPFIVPLAVPLVAGPAVLASVMLYARQEPFAIVLPAIITAWIATTAILLLAPWLQKKLGQRGVTACERLMGLILILLAIQMLLGGIKLFISNC